MSRSLRNVLASAAGRLAVSEPEPFGYLGEEKRELIDLACDRFQIRSFADLGGVWGVEGGYTFYALHRGDIDKAFLVDTDFTARVREQQAPRPALQLIEGNFGSEETIKQIGNVDAVMFFDTLLHQVDPDW